MAHWHGKTTARSAYTSRTGPCSCRIAAAPPPAPLDVFAAATRCHALPRTGGVKPGTGTGASSTDFSIERRTLLAAAALLATTSPALCHPPLSAAAALDPICAALSDPAPRNPGLAWALTNRQKQLLYPPWLRGSWAVTGRFGGAGFPLGRRFLSRTVPGALKASMAVGLPDVGAGMDGPVAFKQRFVDDADQGGVVADRVFNTQQLMNAFLGYPAVTAVTYAPLDNPTRMAVVWTTPRKTDTDQQTNDLRKAEIFINNRGGSSSGSSSGSGSGSGSGTSSGGGGPFCCFELYRQVTQAKQQGAVGDYASYWEFTPLQAAEADGGGSQPAEVSVRQRVAAFLQPQDPLYFDTGDKAVAIYDYTYTYTREQPV